MEWNSVRFKIKDLSPYEKNPRTISKDAFQKLVRSLKEDGYHQRVIATREGKVIGGHQRIKALKEAGYKPSDEIEVLIPDRELTPEEFDRINIRDNLQAGDWDMDILANHFDVEQLIDWGMDENLFPSIEPEIVEPQGDEDEAPEPPKQPRTVLGDIYEIGNHRLMCGDSTSIDAVDKLMDGNKADMVFTDPPYGVDYKGINNDDRGGLEELLSEATGNMKMACKDGASVYMFHSDKCADIFHNVFRNYCHFSSMVIWVKPSLVLSQSDYHSQHEPCLYGWFSNGTHNWYSDRKQTSIWEFGKEHAEGHTTPKPTEMVAYAITNSSKPDESVLDLFGGSGSTMVASHKTNRTCYMMELDPKYCDVIVSRMHKLFPDLPIKLNGQEIDWDE